ncbi:MAG TPA: DUF4331 family protein [Actinomycetota bacterium]
MGDHFDTTIVTPVDDDPRLGVTDLFAFPKPGDPDTSVLILCVSPEEPKAGMGFHPEGVYQINVDLDGDAVTDLAYSVTFSPADGGMQTATVRRATGEPARSREASGEVVVEGAPVSMGPDPAISESGPYRFFAGIRSDPFFADYDGFVNDMQFTGADYFAGKNVLGIVLEVPNTDLGSGAVGIWARANVHKGQETLQVDRIGGPGTNIGFNQGEDMQAYNLLEPTEDVDHAFDKFVSVLVQRSGYSEEEAKGIVGQILPDLLHYDHAQPAGFPNGRRLEDDVIDGAVALFSQGQITSDKTGPHDDYLTDLPYLGPPN